MSVLDLDIFFQHTYFFASKIAKKYLNNVLCLPRPDITHSAAGREGQRQGPAARPSQEQGRRVPAAGPRSHRFKVLIARNGPFIHTHIMQLNR